jgi:pilus assembly protein Flp/PilA
MKDLFTKVKTFILDEEGASAVEYGLLVALIAVAIITAVMSLGTKLSDTFTNVANTIGGGSGRQ